MHKIRRCSGPELSLPTGSSGHLESQGMEDTRMDLSQLEENSGRSVPSTPLQVFPHDELPAAGEEASVVPSSEEQGDFEGGPDLEGDAAAEIDLLGEDDQDTAEGLLSRNKKRCLRQPQKTIRCRKRRLAQPKEPVNSPSCQRHRLHQFDLR